MAVELYRWQKECLKVWKENNHRGIINVITGAGKTVFAMACIQSVLDDMSREKDTPVPYEDLPLRVMIIVPTIPLALQWGTVLRRWFPKLTHGSKSLGYYYGEVKSSPDCRFMVYVINHVENMTVDAANSLLKFLEEPPSNTYAFLTSQNEAKVLPTIISRCEKLRLLLSSRKEVIEEAKNLGVDKEDAEILSHFINDAELLKAETENGDYQTIKDALGDFLDALVQNKGKARFIMETNVIPVLKTKQGLRLFFDIFVLILEEAISKKRGSPIFLESYDTILTALANKLPHLEDTVLSVMTMRGEMELNINSGLNLYLFISINA